MESPDRLDFTRRLVAAHLNDVPMDPPAEGRLKSVADGYAVQAELMHALGHKVGGWKVILDKEGASFGAPAATASIRPSAHLWQRSNGNLATGLEVELAFLLKHDIPPRSQPYDRTEILKHIECVHVVLEVLRGRFANPAAMSFSEGLADNLGNRGLVLGPELPLDPSVLAPELPLEVRIDDRVVWSGTGRHRSADPLIPLLAYANTQGDRLGGMKRGHIVTTGSLCGLIDIPSPAFIAVEWDGSLRVSVDSAL